MKEQSRLRVIYCCCLLPWHTHCASLPFGGQLVCWAAEPFPGQLHYLTKVKMRQLPDIWVREAFLGCV